MIELRNLTTGYSKDKPLLKNCNIIFDRKIYGILGQSGVGKTTLLKTIVGLLKPLDGEVLVDNQPLKAPGKNGIYMMHQSYTSFDWLNCLDNILLAQQIKTSVKDDDVKRAKEMLESVLLSGYEKRYPRQLSGGQKQRLALARTLFMNPPILLMDEPLSALDSKTRVLMQDLVMQNHRRNNNTVIMVTHSQEEAQKMSDIIIKI